MGFLWSNGMGFWSIEYIGSQRGNWGLWYGMVMDKGCVYLSQERVSPTANFPFFPIWKNVLPANINVCYLIQFFSSKLIFSHQRQFEITLDCDPMLILITIWGRNVLFIHLNVILKVMYTYVTFLSQNISQITMSPILIKTKEANKWLLVMFVLRSSRFQSD